MLKLYKGDLLLFTNTGFKPVSEITNNDQLLVLNKEGSLVFDEIEEITKTFKKKYTLNRMDGYLVNDNIELYSLKNIPLNIEMNEMDEYLDNYHKNCIGSTKIGELSTFDYYGFPTITNTDTNDQEENPQFNLNMSMTDLFGLNKKQLLAFYESLAEGNKEIVISNGEMSKFRVIKYLCLLLGTNVSFQWKEGGMINIKIPKKINKFHYNYCNYKNFIWTKIRSIKKVPNYTGNLFYIKTKSGNPYLSDIGLIS